jgi:hypothetical protein
MVTITKEDYDYAVEDNMGFCKHCEEFTHDCCEPDAEGYECPVCEQKTVYGAELAMVMGLFEIDFDEDEEEED